MSPKKNAQGKSYVHGQSQAHTTCYEYWKLEKEEHKQQQDPLLFPLTVKMLNRLCGVREGRGGYYLDSHLGFTDLGLPTLDTANGHIA